jgi:hypothetical protein
MGGDSERDPVPIALNLDDGGPLNLMHWDDPPYPHTIRVPNGFTRRFLDVCEEYGVRGKYSLPPMPAGTGRLDTGLAHLPPRELKEFLALARSRLARRFDITPEILTHQRAYSIEKDTLSHELEDAWFRRRDHGVPEKTAYIGFALKILENVGIRVTGVTSPWMTGRHREQEYAEAIGRAFWKVHRRKFSWYSLHIFTSGVEAGPSVAWRDRKLGLAVAHVPWTTDDYFWGLQFLTTQAARRKAVRAGADALLTRDGKRGRIRELVDAQAPVVLCTHWQSLFCNGNGAGLVCLRTVLERIRKHLGGAVQWMRCSELARAARDA